MSVKSENIFMNLASDSEEADDDQAVTGQNAAAEDLDKKAEQQAQDTKDFIEDVLQKRSEKLKANQKLAYQQLEEIKKKLTKSHSKMLVVDSSNPKNLPYLHTFNKDASKDLPFHENSTVKPYFTQLIDSTVYCPLLIFPIYGNSIEDLIYYHNEDSNPTEKSILLANNNGTFYIRPSKKQGTYVLVIVGSSTYKLQITKIGENGYKFGRTTSSFNELIEKLIISGVKIDNNHYAMPVFPLPSLEKFLRDFDMMIDWDENIEIKRKTGGGNFSEVFFGTYSGRPVAIKKIKSEDESATGINALKPIFREIIIQSVLMSNNSIIPILGVSLHENIPHIIMPWARGGGLNSYMKSKDFLTEKQLVSIIKQTTAGPAYLQSINIVHQDIAARNYLVEDQPCSNQDNALKVTLCDFGLASTLPAVSTVDRAVRWCAPEILLNHHFKFYSDVYSLGLVWLEVLSQGQKPFPFFSFHTLSKLYHKYSDDVLGNSKKHMSLHEYKNVPSFLQGLFKAALTFSKKNRITAKEILEKLDSDLIAKATDAKVQLINLDEVPDIDKNKTTDAAAKDQENAYQ